MVRIIQGVPVTAVTLVCEGDLLSCGIVLDVSGCFSQGLAALEVYKAAADLAARYGVPLVLEADDDSN